MPTPDDTPGELGVNARWYSDPARDAYAWLDSPHAAHRALVDDAIDAVRLVRAADALRQRGTTLRTAAGYEIFIDADSGAAVFALRTAGNDRLLLLRADSPLSAGEANLRCAFVTPHGDLRIAFHRGRFSSRSGGVRRLRGDRPGRRRHRRRRARGVRVPASLAPTSGAAAATRRPCEVELERPADEPSFADAVAAALARRDPSLGARVAVVADLEGAASAERARYHRGIGVPADSDEATGILRALGERGMKVSAIDRGRAFEDVRRVRRRRRRGARRRRDVAGVRVPRDRAGAAERSRSAGTSTPTCRRGCRSASPASCAAPSATAPSWRSRPWRCVMIPGELFVREWFHPYEEHEVTDLLARIGGG